MKTVLTPDQKAFLIIELACYKAPSTVRAAFKEKWGIELATTTIVYYDPDVSPELGKKWRALFAKTRDAFDRRCARVPIRKTEYRLQVLQDTLDEEIAKKNWGGVRATLQQAASEVGGLFTNRTELTGPGGAPLLPSLTVRFVLPSGQQAEAIATPDTPQLPEKTGD